MTPQESKKLELHQQRAANLFTLMLLLELGVRMRGDAMVEQQAAASAQGKAE